MSQPSTPPKPTKSARSPVERVIVWGIILVGLIVVGVEAQAHLAHAAALGNLQSKLKASSETEAGLTQKDVVAIMGSKVPESQKLDAMKTGMGAARVDIYRFPGLVKERKVFVYYGVAGKRKDQEPEVMEVGSVEAETYAEVAAKTPKPDPNAPPAGGGMPEGMRGGGPGGPGGAGPGGAAAGGMSAVPGVGRAALRPAGEEEEKKSDGDAKSEPAAEEKKSDTPAAPDKPATEEKPAEEKAAEEKKPADEAKPATEKPAEPEPKKE